MFQEKEHGQKEVEVQVTPKERNTQPFFEYPVSRRLSKRHGV